MTCPNCNGSHLVVSYHPKYQRCGVCGVLFMVRAEEQLHKFYASGDYRIRKNTQLELQAQRRRAAHIIQYIGTPKVLIDFGASAGALLTAAREKGVTAYGVDIDPIFGAGMYSDLESVPEMADCVTLIHSLEHVPHPLDLLRRVYAKLNPGGRVVIEVPSQFYSGAYAFPHVVMFSDESLAFTMQAAGFEIDEMFFHGNGGILGAQPDYYLLAIGRKSQISLD